MILNASFGSRYSRIVPNWSDKTVIIIGGGSSLTLEQVEAVDESRDDDRKLKCIAINDAYLWAPWADLLYSSDASWFETHRQGIAKPYLKFSAEEVRVQFAAFTGECCSVQQTNDNSIASRVHVVRNRDWPRRGDGLSDDPAEIVTGNNSCIAAINIAVLAGAKRILLLGIDGKAINGRTHWHGGHKQPTPDSFWSDQRKSFAAIEAPLFERGVTVLNCSPGTAIDHFPKVGLAEALECVHS